MIASLVLVSALGFNANPSTKVLALRGGTVGTDVLIDTVSALNAVAGVSAWVAPKKNLEMYGVADPKDIDVFFMRGIAALNVLLATALNSGKSDLNKAALVFVMGHAIQCAATLPIAETLKIPRSGLIGSGFFLLALGQLTQFGILQPAHLTNVATGLYCLISVQEVLLPKVTLKAFGFPDCTALTEMLMTSYSTLKLQLGSFLLVSKLTGQKGLGLVAAMAVSIVNCIRAVLHGHETGVEKAGPLTWLVVQATIGVLAYMSANA